MRKMNASIYKEGKITILEGKQRSGKTLGMSIFALDEFLSNRNPVLTNIAYEHPSTKQLKIPYRPLNFFELTMGHITDFINHTITIDELNFYVGQRSSQSKVNKRFAQWLLQSKKMGIDTYGTTHSIWYLDLMIRENFDYLVNPTTYYEHMKDANGDLMFDEKGEPIKIPAVLLLKMTNGPNQDYFNKTIKVDFRKKPHLLGMYNSRHVFNPFAEIEEQMEREKQEKRAKKGSSGQRLKDLVPDSYSTISPPKNNNMTG